MHLRRFANAVSIGVAVPRERQRGPQTLRALFESLGKGYEAATSARYLNALAEQPRSGVSTDHDSVIAVVSPATGAPVATTQTLAVASELNRSTTLTAAASIPAQELAPTVARSVHAEKPAVSAAVIDQLSNISGKAVATSFFSATPWSLKKSGDAQPAIAAHDLQRAGKLVSKSTNDDAKAVDYFGAIAWKGLSARIISIPASEGIAPENMGNFGFLPNNDIEVNAKQSIEFFRQIPWGRQEQTTTS